jgi:hypothetical protein
MPTKRGPEPVQIEAPVRDAWLRTATLRGPWTWAELKHQFRAFLPAAQSKTLCATLQQWGASPEDLAPLLRLVRAIVFSNAVHRAQMKGATWAAGTARNLHYKATPEVPGALRPLLDIVERVFSDLGQLLEWQFNPPIVLHERDAKNRPTHRTVRLSRLDETVREAVERARRELRWVREALRTDTQRSRGRKATLVQPYRVSARSRSSAGPKAARRRDLVRMVRAEILRLHPKRATYPRVAQAQAGRVARGIIATIPVLN